MNILIINAFGSSQKSKYRFESFCNLVKTLFKKVSKGSGIDNFNFICRSPNNISEFLYKYDMISGDVNQNKKHKKNFDKLDIVIIDGYEKYMPWSNRSFILCEFIKLCKITNKILYAGGVAMEILIFYLATGSLNEYNFVNAKGQIKALEEMASIPTKYIKELKINDNFLDFVTGDILEYKSKETWVPIKNIGLHRQITAEKYFNRGKFVLSSRFRGKDYYKNENAFVTVCNEIKVKITRQYLHHFLVDNLPLEFIAVTSLTWFPHFFNVNNISLQFKNICESDKGPIVVEHQNSIGVLFHINERYQESVIFMENFIRNKFNEVQNKLFKFKNSTNNSKVLKTEKSEIPSIFKTYNSYIDIKKKKIKDEESILNSRKTNLDKVNISRAFNRIKKVKSEAGHVGYGINNRDMIFVENNFINQKPLIYINKIKHSVKLNTYNENEILKDDKPFNIKTKNNGNLFELKNNCDKKINTLKNIKNINIIIDDNNNFGKTIQKRNNIFSNDFKNNLRLNSINLKMKKKDLYLISRNDDLDKKKNLRLKSANIFSNKSQKKPINYNFQFNGINPIFSYSNKRGKKKYFKMRENEDDEYNDKYIPKYPRLANAEEENKLKTASNNFDFLLLSNKKVYNNKTYNFNDELKYNNLQNINFSNKNTYLFNQRNNITYKGNNLKMKLALKPNFN